MKVIAGGMLAVALILFLVSVLAGDGDGPWGFLQTASEAALVGGLADWFAVTALFRHPLGIPIPHTAIIPRKKDQIGASLGSFVQQNFLTGEIVAERVAALDVPQRVGAWLSDPVRATRLAGELGSGLTGAVALLRDDELRASVAQFAEARLHEVPAAPILARVIEAAVEGGQHQEALTGLVKGLGAFLEDNRALFRDRLADESPSWVPDWVDERIFNRMYAGVQDFLADLGDRPDHELRAQFDERLRQYAHDLRTDPETIAKADDLKAQLLDHPAVRAWTGSLWETIKGAVLQAADDPDSELRRAAATLIARTGQALLEDQALAARIDRLLERTAMQVLARYGEDISALIASTVARWDAQETGRRLELQVGRDLQFIRINGTVVGALVGLIIHSVAVLLS
ncbi:MAG: hypothetical protein JWN61_2330 [Pseudonocardiales bacterium]|nr:hypothetical protein [Pseudonocardiales bacterium]